MIWAGITLGAGGFILSHRFREKIDSLGLSLAHAALRRVAAWLSPAPTADDDLLLTGRLISSLQAGISLDAALEASFAEAPPRSALRARLRRLLDGAPIADDFLGSFLRTALETGVPALQSLRTLEQALRARRRLALRATAASATCRAQAEVLSWLPWAMAAAVALVDGSWFLLAARSSLSWLLWAVATLLAGAGRAWLRAAVSRALRPRSEEERLEEEALPDFVLRVIAGVSQGVDAETAAERALAAPSLHRLAQAFRNGAGPRIERLRSTIQHAARTGAPVREELTNGLQDLQAELESRWEERVQRLPVALLAPLFACFLPSSLLVLAGLLWPLLRDTL